MATTPEGRVKKRLDLMLKTARVWFYSPQAGPYGRAGIPDRIAIVEGLFVGIECKADKSKKPTRLQIQCMEQIERAGGKCFVVYDDETIQNVREYIDARRRGKESTATEAEEP